MDNVENMDISKLKVPDLKRELKSRGLSTTGNKNELMERLQSALKSKTDDSADPESVDDLDEDLLNVDDDEHLDGSESGITDIDSGMEITSGQRPQKRKSQDMTTNEQPKQSKKVVLNRSSSTTDVILNDSVEIVEDKTEDKKVIKLSELTAKERLEMRAKKFGIALSGDAQKAVRAERFGKINSNKSTPISPAATPNMDILKQRAERFGVNVSSVITNLDNAERIKRRQERFGLVAENGTPKLDDKKEERLKRFKQGV